MESLINKYKDEYGFIKELEKLYNELLKTLTKEEALEYIYTIYKCNEDIISQIKSDNRKKIELNEKREKQKDFIDYIKQEKIIYKKPQKEVIRQNIDIKFYIDYINENLENNLYLDILPNTKDKDSIMIIDAILTYYLKEKNTYLMLLEMGEDCIELIEDYNSIFNTILEYKNNLLNYVEENKEIENEIVYYMDGDISYLYYDIEDSKEGTIESIKMLIDSIKNGRFKNIKYFSSNGKTKGLLEVRDLSNLTRVLFESLGNRRYCIIGAVIDKRETNSIYKERLINRYSKYKSEKKYSSKDKELERILSV